MKFDDDKKFQLAWVLLSFFVMIFCGLLVWTEYQDSKKNQRIIVDWNSPQFIGSRSGKYSSIFTKLDVDEAVPDDVLDEFEEMEFEDVRSNSELISLYGISFKEGTLSELGIACNSKLFELCNKYYLTTYKGEQLSPLIPMALANNETPGRANHEITYSALFPSACVPVTSASAIENMSCIAVIESADTFKKLASDHWTRDRGALQMNPAYGTGHEAFNSLMGSSEKSILSNARNMGIDFTGYVANEPRFNRTIGVSEWLDNLSEHPGDRHNVKDCILRLASASQDAVDQFTTMYDINDDYHALTIIAQHHGSSSIWLKQYRDKAIGNWRTGYSAYKYSLDVTSNDFIMMLKEYCSDVLQTARDKGKCPAMSLDRKTAKKLWNQAVDKGYLQDYSFYVREGNYFEVTYLYPVQALYNYMMLGLVYSGR